jgi:5'-deoxynucleotidase
MPNIRTENVHEHSMDVALIADLLCAIRNELFEGSVNAGEAVRAALYHDASEIFTGDVATPVKYANPEIKKCLKAAETEACTKLIGMLPDSIQAAYRDSFFPSQDIKELVKAADKLSGLTKCILERKLGNSEFGDAEESHHSWLRENCGHMHEVGYFVDHCIPAYESSLDKVLRR